MHHIYRGAGRGGGAWQAVKVDCSTAAEGEPVAPAYDFSKYAICVPYWGSVDGAHRDCMDALRTRYDRFRVTGCAYVDVARAALCKMAERHAGVFFIDHDILFDPEDVALLIAAAEERQTPVSGVYCQRNHGRGELVGAFDPEHGTVQCFDAGGLYKGVYGGLGFTAIPRHVLEAVGRDMPEVDCSFLDKVRPLFALDTTRGFYSGEDISFYRRATDAGFPLLLHTVPRLWHVGRYEYGLEDAELAVPRYTTLTIATAQERAPAVDPEELRAMLGAA